MAEKKKAEEAKRKAEAQQREAEKKAAEAKRRQQEQEAALNELFSDLASDSVQRSGAKAQFIDDEANRLGSIYEQMIQRNLIYDDSMRGKECRVNIRLTGTGVVLDVSQISGDASVCRATKAAVLKVPAFPMSDDPDVNKKLRDINLTFAPAK
ncbi:cell envelope integrity protein TolA [Veronia nyctiphanis]|uniref:cell envelope integrity protein TolA n=1 Tax=Veronia nyctiphanis TaxID=1278244 RepID=UPI001F1D4600|nr:cell envelope integrity protein TolA [Veronia nyctiphanis]